MKWSCCRSPYTPEDKLPGVLRIFLEFHGLPAKSTHWKDLENWKSTSMLSESLLRALVDLYFEVAEMYSYEPPGTLETRQIILRKVMRKARGLYKPLPTITGPRPGKISPYTTSPYQDPPETKAEMADGNGEGDAEEDDDWEKVEGDNIAKGWQEVGEKDQEDDVYTLEYEDDDYNTVVPRSRQPTRQFGKVRTSFDNGVGNSGFKRASTRGGQAPEKT